MKRANAIPMIRGDEKPTGLIWATVDDSPAAAEERAKRRRFIDKWKQEHPHFGQELNELTKAKLVDLYIRSTVGASYDSAVLMAGTTAQSPEITSRSIEATCDALLTGDHAEARASVVTWLKKEISAAGKNTAEIFNVAMVAGAFLSTREMKKYTKGLTQEGRAKGGASTKEKFDARVARISALVESFLMNPAQSGILDGEIATFLMTPPRAEHKFKGGEVSRRTMLRTINKIREDFKMRGRLAG